MQTYEPIRLIQNPVSAFTSQECLLDIFFMIFTIWWSVKNLFSGQIDNNFCHYLAMKLDGEIQKSMWQFKTYISNAYFIKTFRRHLLELLLHHVIVLSCAIPCALFEKFAGLTMMAMTVEVNSVFLHSRRLLKFCHQSSGFYYALNAVLNIISNILFRLIGCLWIIYYSVHNCQKLGLLWSSICVSGATLVLIMSFILLLRCIKVDVFTVNPNKVK